VTHRPPLLTMLASLAVHAAALAVLFLFVSGEPVASVLVIDLSELESGSDRPGPKNEPARSPRPSRRAAAASVPSAPATSPASARASAESVPPAPSNPEPTPLPERGVVPAKPESRPPDPTTVEAPRDETTVASPRSGSNAPAVAASSDPTSETSGAGAGRGSIPGPQAATGGTGLGVALAPAGPPGGTLGSEYGPYYRKIRQRIQESLEYPPAARRQGIKGTVMLELLIKPDGAISAIVKVSSSHRLLDDAALETVRNLPRQPFPPGLAPKQLTVPLPIVFDLK
jgi:protein TonB